MIKNAYNHVYEWNYLGINLKLISNISNKIKYSEVSKMNRTFKILYCF